MKKLTLRTEKGTELTFEEMDNNFKLIKTVRGSFDESKRLTLIEVTDDSALSSITLDEPLAYIEVKGKLVQFDSDGYGNYSLDGYGNYIYSTKDIDESFIVVAKDDGYGNTTFYYKDTYFVTDNKLSLQTNTDKKKYVFDLDVSCIFLQDIDENKIKCGFNFVD